MLTKAQITDLRRIEVEADRCRERMDQLKEEAAAILEVHRYNDWVCDLVGGGSDLKRVLEALGHGGQI